MIRDFPTPPARTEFSRKKWESYSIRALGWLMEAVERTETRGLSVSCQWDLPGDSGSAQARAFFCQSCSELHLEIQIFDAAGDTLGDPIRPVPDTIRLELRKMGIHVVGGQG